MKIRFVSKNNFKFQEVKSIITTPDIEVIQICKSVCELQTENVDDLIKDKLLKAFAIVGKPVFVEHTCLYIDKLGGFPGGLTQIFWDKLQADNFCSLLGKSEASAKTVIGYCDTRKMFFFDGELSGVIATQPKGSRDFQWDCVFIPNGETETFAEMESKKNDISMRKLAFDKFRSFLDKGAQ
jgi:XTP/dITP diphosphohydrolase